MLLSVKYINKTKQSILSFQFPDSVQKAFKNKATVDGLPSGGHSMFVQNSLIDITLSENNMDLWIKNSCIAESWNLSSKHVLTGIPKNDWSLSIPMGICLDISLLDDRRIVIRPYGMNDPFRGELGDKNTNWLNVSFSSWLNDRRFTLQEAGFLPDQDIFSAELFPIVSSNSTTEVLIQWIIIGTGKGKELWLKSERVSANKISELANLDIAELQRIKYRCLNWTQLSKNYNRSVFYQIKLFALCHLLY